jgi:thiopurine S-methyltransferase
MEPAFWHRRWENREIGFHQQDINTHLQRFWPRLALPAGSLVFVPLCGKSRDMLWLLGEGYRVLGVEVSPIAVSAFFEENGLAPRIRAVDRFELWRNGEVELLLGDFFELEADRLSDAAGVYDRASLIALPPAMRGPYARHLRSILPPRAPVLLVTLEYPEGQMQGPPFAVAEAEVHELFDADYRVELLLRFDALAENPGLAKRGLQRLEEHVFRLEPRSRVPQPRPVAP